MGSTKINDRWSRAQSREMALLTQLGQGLINAAHEWRGAREGCRAPRAIMRARQTPSPAPNALCRAMQAYCRARTARGPAPTVSCTLPHSRSTRCHALLSRRYFPLSARHPISATLLSRPRGVVLTVCLIVVLAARSTSVCPS